MTADVTGAVKGRNSLIAGVDDTLTDWPISDVNKKPILSQDIALALMLTCTAY